LQAPSPHRFDPFWFGPPLWLCREPSRPKPLWYDMLRRVGRGLSTDAFPVACSRRGRLVRFATRRPRSGASSEIPGAPCSEEREVPQSLGNPKTSKIRRPLKPQDLENSKTREIRRPPKSLNLFRGGGSLSPGRSREVPSAEASGFACRVLRLGGSFRASVRRPPRKSLVPCVPRSNPKVLTARARRLWLVGVVSGSARSPRLDPKVSLKSPRKVGRSPLLIVPKVI
jgi:hypothetical protein